MRPINVISLFDGKACARVALERAGIPVANYYASEIDKYAMLIAKKNYPDIQHVGDVTKLQHVDWTGIDLLCGGSPCQGFSFAGKQLNFNDPRSALFFEFVRIWNEIKAVNPNAKFFLENVVMKQEYQDVISGLLGVKPVMVNSALVSAQDRKRLYWTNIEGFVMPEDKNLFIKDVVCDDEDVSIDLYTPLKSFKNLTHTKNYAKYDINGLGNSSTDQRYFYFDKKIGCLSTNCDRNNKIETPKGVRKITHREMERFQTLPEKYTDSVTKAQAAKMIGNGWTIDVIVEFLKNLKPDTDFSENLDF